MTGEVIKEKEGQEITHLDPTATTNLNLHKTQTSKKKDESHQHEEETSTGNPNTFNSSYDNTIILNKFETHLQLNANEENCTGLSTVMQDKNSIHSKLDIRPELASKRKK